MAYTRHRYLGLVEHIIFVEPPWPVQKPFRVLLCAALTLLKCHRSIPGQSIAAVGALKSGLWATAGGEKGPEPHPNTEPGDLAQE